MERCGQYVQAGGKVDVWRLVPEKRLDELEQKMVTLEEQKLSGGDTRKLKLYVRSSLLRIKGEMKRGPAMSARAVR